MTDSPDELREAANEAARQLRDAMDALAYDHYVVAFPNLTVWAERKQEDSRAAREAIRQNVKEARKP